MKIVVRLQYVTLLVLLGSIFLFSGKPALPVPQDSGNSPILPPLSSNWAATDGAGRKLPMSGEVPRYKGGKYVGMFYFLWHGHDVTPVYDISKLIRQNPAKPAYGPAGAFHWWGEPETGYFRADDPWLIRRNLQLLTLAGVDILFLDVTNAITYLPTVEKLCRIAVTMRHQGIPVPYITFVTNARGTETITELYRHFYAPNKFSELWFRWQGKPLVLGQERDMTDPAIRNFFTWRYSWAWTNSRNEPHHWQWIDRTPQHYGWDKDPAVPEEIPVAVASHPTLNVGKSHQKGVQKAISGQGRTAITEQGAYFAEQWQRALQVDPQVVFVTGWNEWIAQRFVAQDTPNGRQPDGSFMGKPLKKGESFFVDLYNEEYNRDIDPMKNGYTDNYYYQLVANIRWFKGMDVPAPATTARTIQIDGTFDEWKTVEPLYGDPTGDTEHRNWLGYDNKRRYANATGRNDITQARMTYDGKNLYAYVQTAGKLTAPTGKNWMLLFLDTDQSAKTGWAGYDYLIQPDKQGTTCTISRWTGKTWQVVQQGAARFSGTGLELAIPRTALKLTGNRIAVDFHWADNIQRLNAITEFFLNGDSAPDRRFNYRFVSR
nr:hypothetical protein [uncultured Arsenicibacter sp.]